MTDVRMADRYPQFAYIPEFTGQVYFIEQIMREKHLQRFSRNILPRHINRLAKTVVRVIDIEIAVEYDYGSRNRIIDGIAEFFRFKQRS